MQNTAAVGARLVSVDQGSSDSSVSRQWLSRSPDQKFLSLELLEKNVADRRLVSREFRTATKRIEFLAPPNPQTINETHDLQVGLSTGEILNPSHFSFGQLATLAKAPAAYLRTLPSQLTADALSYSLRYAREAEDVKLYARGPELAAATSPTYGRIFDEEIVAAVRAFVDSSGGRFKVPGVLDWRTMVYDPDAPVTLDSTTLYASDRDVFVLLVDDRHPIEIGKLPGGEPDYVFRALIVSNSEVGSGAFVITTMLVRGVCQNRILWGVEQSQTLRLVHSSGAPARFIEQAKPALIAYSEGSSAGIIEGVTRAKEAIEAANDDDALAFLQGRDFSKKLSAQVLETVEREEGHPARSRWDFVQGLTAVARDIAFNDERLDLEKAAGKLMA